MRYRNYPGTYLISAICALLPPVTEAGIPATERAALMALYDSTGGQNWTDNMGWGEAGSSMRFSPTRVMGRGGEVRGAATLRLR
jgi:hypothetical protein